MCILAIYNITSYNTDKFHNNKCKINDKTSEEILHVTTQQRNQQYKSTNKTRRTKQEVPKNAKQSLHYQTLQLIINLTVIQTSY